MSDSPVILADVGDGKQRRLFLSADELRILKRETGRGFWSLYRQFQVDADPDEVATVIRLALIGGGLAPQEAPDLTDYYCRPPRPLKQAYLTAYEALNAAWNGAPDPRASGKAKPLTAEQMDAYFVALEAALVKGGKDVSAIRGKSFAEIQELMLALHDEQDAPAAPDAATVNAIKATTRKARAK